MLHLTIITPTAAALAIISLLLLFLLTYKKKFIRMLKCNIATFKYFNADCVDVNSMRRYIIQIHCRREES
jgi:hypothetical protein